jgi:predicted alpha/beta superfamily hydrolase
MTRQPDGSFGVDVDFNDGKYFYKFVIDGQTWAPDPLNPDREPDTYGGANSVLVIGNFDLEPRSPSPPKYVNPVTIEVDGVPDGFRENWIPVRYGEGHLQFDDSKSTQSRLLLSRKALGSWGADAGTSDRLVASRQLFVWLPREYFTQPERRFPVVYLHDGQNVWDDRTCCFGHGGWDLNGTMDTMTTIPRAILVGIPNSPARYWEYGPGDDILAGKPTPYVRFLCEVVKPSVDAEFRTLRDPGHTTAMGSSMGGVVSLICGYTRPDVFGNVVAMSTAFQVPDTTSHTLTGLLQEKGRGEFRLYLDSGTAGDRQDGAPLTREFAKLAADHGWGAGKDFAHFEDEGAEHNEKAWRARAWRGLLFALEHAAPAQ